MYLRSLLVAVCVLASLCALPQGGKAFLKEGDDLRKQGQLEQALERYTLAVQVDPKLMKAWQAKAEVNELLGRKIESAQDRLKISNLEPQNGLYATQAAIAYLEIDSVSAALDILEHALLVDPKNMDALLTMTRACLAKGDVDRANASADKALALKATTDSYYYHALARSAARDPKTAEFDLDKVLEWNPMYEPAYVALAEVQLVLWENYSGSTMKVRTLEKAIEKCTRALELNPNSTDALFTRSKAYANGKEYAKAIDDVSKCVALGRTNHLVYLQRAKYYHGFGQHQNAVNDLNKALLDRPGDVELLMLRAECKEANLDMDGALRDLELAQKAMEQDGKFSAEAKKGLEASRDRIAKQVFEMNRESDPPIISVLEPYRRNDVYQVSSSIDHVKVSGYVRDKSLLKSITVNGNSADFSKDEKDPQFVVNVPFERNDTLIIVQSMDVYGNMNSVELPVVRTEGVAPSIAITSPRPTGDRELTVSSGKEDVFIEGRVSDASLIRMVSVNGINASYAPDQLNPDFSIKTAIKDQDRITVRAEDQYGNSTEIFYTIVRKTEPVVAAKPVESHSTPGTTGVTWIVHVDNSNYRNFPALQVNPSDAQKMQKAFSSYNVQKTISKKNLTKEQMDRFFNIELRDMVRQNKVNTILVWYSGHGRSVGGKAYWIPIDGKKDDIYSFFNYGALKNQMQNYSESVNNTLVISDATGADPSFYELTR
jgi:tetratricopeptide (TPR) repeat protein